MARPANVPESSMLRLSRYHCFLGELIGESGGRRIRSREMAEALGVSEETVRRDLSYVDIEGRPGAGYDPESLHAALQEFLDLSALHPFVAVGNAKMLEGLTVTFPAQAFDLRPVAYFSERREDAGTVVAGIEVRHISEIPEIDPSLGAKIAVVACDPGSVQETLDLLCRAGIGGVVMLTPVLRPQHPAGMNVTYFRIPCALKSLASAAVTTCCAASRITAVQADTPKLDRATPA